MDLGLGLLQLEMSLDRQPLASPELGLGIAGAAGGDCTRTAKEDLSVQGGAAVVSC